MIAESAVHERFRTVLLMAFAIFAVLLGAAGVFGVTAGAVTRRTRELGVRIALGAGHGTLVRLVLGHAALLTLAGVLLGLIAAMAAGSVIGGLLYEVSPLDPLTYGAVALVLAVVALAAAYPPALRATRLDPIKCLNAE